ncbi:MAG: zinc ribbon domain-containing protein [Calditrichaeota bacterium]|nr:zinc ribbon domain-containing protein [Calditrichota bacterium]MCB0304870.1 zinc ribbon domain-containing protein [Calditrichota bacterium]MCB0312662.1 zinc ribbon domain-containing protein [Calditrichota bacterium]
MPLFDYRCKTCGTKFETLVFSSQKGPVKCEQCGSEETEKLMSSFAAHCSGFGSSSGSSSSGGGCASTGGFT